MQLVFLEIETDEGVTGLAGPIGHEVAYIVDQQFRGLLTGEDPIVPVNGYVTVPERPGMGMEIDMAKVESERLLDWTDKPVASQ